MEYLEAFSNEESSTLIDRDNCYRQAIKRSDSCVIETTLASDNDLGVGDTITVYTATVNDETLSKTFNNCQEFMK